MSKLGYTWYAKDWSSSESVFELELSERGLFRELIDLAMLNDNKTTVKIKVWCRKFNVSIDELNTILDKLISLNLIVINDTNLFIPSCEKRLNYSRNGKKGGSKTSTQKPNNKKFTSETEANVQAKVKQTVKPEAKQRERERERESNNKSKIAVVDYSIHQTFEKEIIIDTFSLENLSRIHSTNIKTIKHYLNLFNSHLVGEREVKTNLKEYQTHFNNWMRRQNVKTIQEHYKYQGEVHGIAPLKKVN